MADSSVTVLFRKIFILFSLSPSHFLKILQKSVWFLNKIVVSHDNINSPQSAKENIKKPNNKQTNISCTSCFPGMKIINFKKNIGRILRNYIICRRKPLLEINSQDSGKIHKHTCSLFNPSNSDPCTRAVPGYGAFWRAVTSTSPTGFGR